MEQIIAATARGRRLLAPHRIRAGPVRHRAEHRRHPRPAQARAAAASDRRRRSSPTCATASTTRSPLVDIEFVQLLQDMLGDLEGNPEPIEVKIFGDDPTRLAELAEPVEEMLEQDRRRRRRRRHPGGQPGGDLDDRSGGGRRATA